MSVKRKLTDGTVDLDAFFEPTHERYTTERWVLMVFDVSKKKTDRRHGGFWMLFWSRRANSARRHDGFLIVSEVGNKINNRWYGGNRVLYDGTVDFS